MEGYHVPQTHPQLLPSSMPKTSQSSRQPPGLTQTNLYFMRTLGEGMAGMTHENDIRIAEGLQNIELPADPAAAMATWRSTLNDAVVNWHRARGCDIPDLNELARRGIVEAINFAFPHYFRAAALQQRLVVPDPPARSRGDAVRDLVAHPHPAGPGHRQADTARADGTRRPPLAANPRPGLLQPAQAAKRVALQGL